MLSWLFSDPLPVGTPAPDFTLVDETGHPVTLSTLRGKSVVLVFYPGDDTPG
jgi:peroxiredoxin Q/BCP